MKAYLVTPSTWLQMGKEGGGKLSDLARGGRKQRGWWDKVFTTDECMEHYILSACHQDKLPLDTATLVNLAQNFSPELRCLLASHWFDTSELGKDDMPYFFSSPELQALEQYKTDSSNNASEPWMYFLSTCTKICGFGIEILPTNRVSDWQKDWVGPAGRPEEARIATKAILAMARRMNTGRVVSCCHINLVQAALSLCNVIDEEKLLTLFKSRVQYLWQFNYETSLWDYRRATYTPEYIAKELARSPSAEYQVYGLTILATHLKEDDYPVEVNGVEYDREGGPQALMQAAMNVQLSSSSLVAVPASSVVLDKQDLEEGFTCGVCFEFRPENILFCPDGHAVCTSCKESAEKANREADPPRANCCPTCRGPFPNGNVPWLMRACKQKCTHCDQMVSLTGMQKHLQQECQRVPVHSPLGEPKRFPPSLSAVPNDELLSSLDNEYFEDQLPRLSGSFKFEPRTVPSDEMIAYLGKSNTGKFAYIQRHLLHWTQGTRCRTLEEMTCYHYSRVQPDHEKRYVIDNKFVWTLEEGVFYHLQFKVLGRHLYYTVRRMNNGKCNSIQMCINFTKSSKHQVMLTPDPPASTSEEASMYGMRLGNRVAIPQGEDIKQIDIAMN